MRFSLQSTLNLRFVAATTLPLLVFGWFAYHYMVERQMQGARTSLQAHALMIREEVTDFFTEIQKSALFLRGTAGRLRTADPAKLDALLQDVVNQAGHFEALFLLDEHMRVRSFGLANSQSAQRRDYEDLDLSRFGVFPCKSPPCAAGDSASSADVSWSDTFISMVTGKPSVMLRLKLPEGFLLGTVNLDQLAIYLQRYMLEAKEMTFAVIDHRGTLVAHSDSKQAIERNNYRNHPEVQAALATGQESTARWHESNDLLESVCLIPQTGWVAYVAMSRETVLQDARQLRMILASILVLAVVFGIGLAFWQARYVIRPLLALRDSTQGVARGDYRGLERLGNAGYAELDDLSANFLEMGAAVMERETFLRASEERYRSLIAGMGEGLLIIDRDGRIVDCNGVAERILGLTRNELLNQETMIERWRAIREDGTPCPPDEYPGSVTLRTGADVNNEVLGLCLPDGREIWLQMNSRPQWSLHGDINAAVVTFADVSQLKAAEASLRIGKQRYQELFQQFSALLEGITDRIYLLTPDLRIVWSNHEPDDVPGGNNVSGEGCCFTRFWGRSEPCPDCPVLRCFASGRRENGEIEVREGLIWNLRAFPVRSENAVSHVVLIAEDITEKLQGERQRSRASQLAALGELAAGVAHEINNPISGVINYAQLILNRTTDGSREYDLAQRIIREGDRIATIVRELLTFAREDSSDIKIVSIREALAEALSLCESQLRKESIDLRIDLPADLPPVESRSHQIQQLFLNLLSNSRHALTDKYPGSHEDKILLICGREIELSGRRFLRLKVRDHGSGIPKEMLERVMTPFVTTKPAGVGTGLGLSISFEIAKKHGGMLSIASEHGAWTEVTVDLPVCLAARQEPFEKVRQLHG